MESFALAASHSGAINHVHSFHFSDSAITVAREVRLATTVVVAGWVAVTVVRELLRGWNTHRRG